MVSHTIRSYRAFLSATIAARTASTGPVAGPRCGGIEPPLAIVALAGPCIGAFRFWMAGQHMHHALPDRLALVPLVYGHRLCALLLANGLSAERRTQIIGALVEGNSIRLIEPMTGTHRDTIMRL